MCNIFSFFKIILFPQKSEVPPDYDKHEPEQKQIYRFVRTLFSAAQLTAECAIVTLVSIQKIIVEILKTQLILDPQFKIYVWS